MHVRGSVLNLHDQHPIGPFTRAGAIETDLDVSQFGEPERFTATFAGQPLYEATYTRDALGRITHMDEVIAGQSRSVTYDYDDAGRLAYIEEPGQPARELLYDPNGNLVEIREAGIPVLAASHDAQDRLQTHGHLELTYTDSGHLETKLDTHTGERTAYDYDEFGNLLGVELADGRSIQYLVDGADRRVAKLVDGALQWLFVYAGGLPVARLHPDGSVESIYVYGALAHVPDLVIKDGRTYRIVHDHLGSPRLVVDAETGEIAQRLDYDIFGRVLADTSPDFQPFGFAGGLHALGTGVVRLGASDYDPAKPAGPSATLTIRFVGQIRSTSSIRRNTMRCRRVSRRMHRGSSARCLPPPALTKPRGSTTS